MKLSAKIHRYINPPEGESRIAPAPDEVEKWAEEVERLEGVIEAVRGGNVGAFYPARFRHWAETIERQQGYRSILTEWLVEVAQALAMLDEEGGESD